jgi:hypothetical protein
MSAGRVDEAIPIYETLLSASRATRSDAELAVAEFKAGRYKEVIERCRALCSASARRDGPWLFLGASHFQLGQTGKRWSLSGGAGPAE